MSAKKDSKELLRLPTIQLTQWIDRKRVPISVDVAKIEYLTPHLGECEVYFVDGSSITVTETPEQIQAIIIKALRQQ